MSRFDLEAFLSEISPNAPCGEDLSYSSAFLELERLAQGTEETEMGEHIQESEEPDWKKVYTESLQLLERSRDLRLILYLTVSKLSLEGLAGFQDGLVLLRSSVERYWDHLFPQLDPDDDLDPLERMNIIASLSPTQSVMSDEDPIKCISRLMQVPLCRPADTRLPRPSLRQILVASGELTVPEAKARDFPAKQLIDAAFEQVEITQLQTTNRVLQGCLEHLQALDQSLIKYVGAESAPNFNNLEQVLKQMQAKTAQYLERRGYGQDDSALMQTGITLQDQAEGSSPDPNANPSKTGTLNQQLSGQITSNQDIHQALDMMISYYEMNEPSSPVPLLLKRAKRLVGRNFMDIIRNLSPDALSQVQVFSGDEEESSEE